MTWINRLRLLGGLLGIVLLVALLTLIFNQRQTKAASLTATVNADTYDVGAAYGGTVTKQYVSEGDRVTNGEKLFTVQSVGLQQDIANGLTIQSSEAYDVNPKSGTLTYKATVSGYVSHLEAKMGNSLGIGEPFAQITVTNSQYVDAHYLLTARDYGRVQKGASASILLPNRQSISGEVSTIEVATENGEARTDVRISSDALRDGKLGDLAQPGTPVVATVHLQDDGPLAGLSDLAFDFLRKIGMR
jgi:multidrug resistance efflux pump